MNGLVLSHSIVSVDISVSISTNIKPLLKDAVQSPGDCTLTAALVIIFNSRIGFTQ